VKATEAKLMSFLQKSPQFVIPIYQRTYSWTDKQCRQLWDAATLAAHQPDKAPSTGSYTIADHPHLLTSGLREVFEAFRKEVLALDPCVTEEFMKRYVAYKPETNFVDVVPQSKRLRLSINLAFAEINDPKGLCKDVTNLGRWGNGDVEVGLKSLDELSHVMGLVRQSYERRMGDGGQA